MATERLAPPVSVVRSRSARLEGLAGQLWALLVSLALALLAGPLLIIAHGGSPSTVYSSILKYSVESADGIGYVLAIATPLIFSALAVAVCFKGGMFNIGVEGHFLVAMVTAAWAEAELGFLPGPILVVVVLIAAMLGGMIWAAIPGVLKVKTGAHEVVTTIMLNGIAISLLAWAINFPLKFSNAPPGQNVDLRTDQFPEGGLIGDIGHYFGVTPSAHLSWLFLLAVGAAIV